MPSSWGSKRGMVGYDQFRTGLTYREVWEMLRCDSDDSALWRYKRRGTILGMWHELKLQLWHQYINAMEERGRDDENSRSKNMVTVL